MKMLKELLKSQHCKLLEINENKLSIAFLMPDKKTRVSSTASKRLDKMTEREMMEFIADSISGARKK